jgi:hypothetical protein
MAVYIGSARINEKNRVVGGREGDQKQTGTPDYKGEVSMEKFYVHQLGWNVYRPKKVEHAMGIAASMIQACNNKNVGYGQDGRLLILKYGTNAQVPVEADCGTLIRQCVKEATGVDTGSFTTANEGQKLMATGLFDKIPYVAGMTLYTGDILCTKSQGHTVAVTNGAARSTATAGKYYPVYAGKTTSIVEALKSVGEKDTSFSHRKQIAVANGIKNYGGTAVQNTTMLNLLKQGRLKKG